MTPPPPPPPEVEMAPPPRPARRMVLEPPPSPVPEVRKKSLPHPISLGLWSDETMVCPPPVGMAPSSREARKEMAPPPPPPPEVEMAPPPRPARRMVLEPPPSPVPEVRKKSLSHPISLGLLSDKTMVCPPPVGMAPFQRKEREEMAPPPITNYILFMIYCFVGDNLVVFCYLSASEICPDKRGGLSRGEPLSSILLSQCI